MRFRHAPFLALCVALGAQAQDAPSIRDLSLAAGYTAMFTCSATFNGGKTHAQILNDELTNIYPDYGLAMAATGETEIDRVRQQVRVTYETPSGEAVRISQWRPYLGCSALPPQAAPGMAAKLPKVSFADTPDRSDALWPMGDVLPNSGLPTDQQVALDAVIGQAFAGEFGGVSSAALIVQDGQIVGELYKPGFDYKTAQRTWSVAKSIGASVIGAAIQDKLIATDEPAGLEAWARPGDPRQAITVDHLLRMSSGLDSEPAGNRTDDVYFGGGLVAEHATDGALDVPPGTRYRYANNDTMLALRALRERMESREAYNAYPFEALLHKIGMTRTTPETDWDGDFVLSSQVWTTSRDLARLGLLYLGDGVWNGERILPEGWVDYVTDTSGPQPYGPRRPEGCHRGYGAQFWLYHDCPGVPEGTYAALGNRGQFLIIVPDRDVIIVRRGYDYQGERFDGPGFTAAVLSALE